MTWIMKMVWIVAMMVSGQIQVQEVPEVQEPVVIEDTVVVEEVWVDVQGEAEEVYPDFRVVEYKDSQGVVSYVPDLPSSVSPEDNWAMFWALNPEIEAMVDSNKE